MARGRKPANPAQEAIAEEVSVIGEVKPEVPDKRDEEIALLKEQIATMKQMMEQMQSAQPQSVIQVAAPEGERIHFIFEAEVADDNVFLIGENGMYGRITGKSGMFYVPKNDFSRINDGLFRLMLDKRWIIAVDGFSKEERESLGIDYKEGEYLDKKAFAKMVDLGDEMLEIYPKLCDGHKEMVAKRFYEAFKAGNPKITRDLVVKPNKLSKESGSEKGDFYAIIEQMNAKDAE